jgi:uncharacterized protein (TIGR02996 family)
MLDDTAFIHAIEADPQDDATRLIYADWLEERGDPRGPFIRVQTELTRLLPGADSRDQLAAREKELLPLAVDAYRRGVPAEVAHYFSSDIRDYGGGLLRGITLYADQVDAFGEHATVLFRYAPVERLSFEPRGMPTYSGGQFVFATSTECINKLLRVPVLARLTSLVLHGPFEDLDAVVAALVACAAVAGLSCLEFSERQDERDMDFRPQEMSERSRRGLRERFGHRVRFR